MIVLMEGRKRRLVCQWVKFPQVTKLFGNGNGATAATGMIILDDDLDIRQVLFDRCFSIAEPNRLKTHIGIIEILNGRLDEEKFHGRSRC
jgi:hypothetical protein